MKDKRRQPRLKSPRNHVPHDIPCNNISVMLNNADYRMFYEIVMHRGESGADTIRQMIQEEYKRIKNQD